jgi:uncharacterized protein
MPLSASPPSSRSTAARWAQLLIGLLAFAVSIALMIRGGLGLGPWDAFHVGLHRLTGMTVGTASILAGIVIVGISMVLKARLGPATIANMVLIGIFTDLALPIVPDAPGFMSGLAYHVAGIALIGLATGMYLGAGLGAGPRDGLMTALAARYGWSISRTRTGIELSVLGLGWLMGGTLGLGTILFAVAVGPSVQWGMRLFGLIRPVPVVAGLDSGASSDPESRDVPPRPASIA